MQTRAFCLLLGIVYVAIGVLAIFPAFRTAPHPAPTVELTAAYGNFLGLFPTNLFADIARIVIGFYAIASGRTLDSARRFCSLAFVFFGALTFLGFVSSVNTLFGAVPIYWNTIWIDGATAFLAGVFGFVVPEPTYVEPAPEVAQAH